MTSQGDDKPTLRPDQIQDLAFYISHHRCANLSDPGTGKTPSVCAYLWYLWSELGERSIWTMPKSLLEKNQDELLRFSEFKPEDIVIVDGSPSERAARMRSDGKVFLMGFRRFAEDWKTLLDLHPDINCLAVDELHFRGGFTTHNSQATEAFFRAMRRIKRLVGMTGSLINGRLDSAYPLIKVLEPRIYFDYFAFYYQHAILDYDGNLVGWRNHEKIGEILNLHAIRRPFEAVHGKKNVVILPPKQVQMHPKQRKAYDQFHKDAYLELEKFILDGTLPGVATIRARQIMAHPHTMGILKPNELTGKEEQLRIDLADAINRQEAMVIYAALVPEQERLAEICEKEGFKIGIMNGGNRRERSSLDKAFRAGELDGLVCSPDVASVGFNWSRADHIVFVSMDYQDTNFKQAYMRGLRGKREKPLRVSVYKYADSIDDRVMQIVERKSNDAHKVDSTYEKIEFQPPEVKPKPKTKKTKEPEAHDFSLASF